MLEATTCRYVFSVARLFRNHTRVVVSQKNCSGSCCYQRRCCDRQALLFRPRSRSTAGPFLARKPRRECLCSTSENDVRGDMGALYGEQTQQGPSVASTPTYFLRSTKCHPSRGKINGEQRGGCECDRPLQTSSSPRGSVFIWFQAYRGVAARGERHSAQCLNGPSRPSL